MQRIIKGVLGDYVGTRFGECPQRHLGENMRNREKFALITGASSGLGKEFALQLSDHFNLVLVGRNAEALHELADTCSAQHTLCEVMVADLSNPTDLARVEARAAKPNVGLLINNAGFGTAGLFHELPLEAELAQVDLHVAVVTRLTHAALKTMVAQKEGGIINVSSIAAFQPAPYSATYAATKTFVRYFSEAIAEEVRSKGVYVQALCPGFTHTEFHKRAAISKNRIPEFMWSTVDEVVDASLRALERRQVVCIPGAVNKVLATLSDTAPTALTARVTGNLFRFGLAKDAGPGNPAL